MKILAFAGSTSSVSINKALLNHTLTFFKDDDINLLDLNDFDLPVYSFDNEQKNGHPENAKKFLQAIEEADAIVCSFAEHNANFAVAFKNLFDWASRIQMNVFQNKPMLIMATSPGPFGGGNVLDIAEKVLPRYGADIKAVFSLPEFGENFNASEGITKPELKEKHYSKVEYFKTQIA